MCVRVWCRPQQSQYYYRGWWQLTFEISSTDGSKFAGTRGLRRSTQTTAFLPHSDAKPSVARYILNPPSCKRRSSSIRPLVSFPPFFFFFLLSYIFASPFFSFHKIRLLHVFCSFPRLSPLSRKYQQFHLIKIWKPPLSLSLFLSSSLPLCTIYEPILFPSGTHLQCHTTSQPPAVVALLLDPVFIFYRLYHRVD